jgi:hypothetical protein
VCSNMNGVLQLCICKISGGAASRCLYLFINWGMATDIKLVDYICTCIKKELKKKGLIIICYR